MSISVLIADDQPLMRAALRLSLTSEPDIELAGEAADGRQAVELAERTRPDVVIMDIRMPHVDGVAATRQLTTPGDVKPVKVLVITTFDLDEYVVEALRAGASGFLVKDATPEELVYAVRKIAAGNALLAPSITRRMLDRYARRRSPHRVWRCWTSSPTASSRCSTWWRAAIRTPRSGRRSTWPRAPSRPTSVIFWPSLASPTACTS